MWLVKLLNRISIVKISALFHLEMNRLSAILVLFYIIGYSGSVLCNQAGSSQLKEKYVSNNFII